MKSRKMLRSKIHRATVTQADLNYEGSLTMPPEILKLADICEFEAVNVWNVTRGTRFETYAICGKPGSNDFCVNGAAAHLAGPGDIIIVATYSHVPENEVSTHKPIALFVDAKNRPTEIRPERLPE